MERGRSEGVQDEGTGRECTRMDGQRGEKGTARESLVDGAQISFALLATDHKK